MGIDINNGFTPKYEVSEDKKCCFRVKENVKLQIQFDYTDEDRGEAIVAFKEVLNLDQKDTKDSFS